jgi:methylation protein EvaC
VNEAIAQGMERHGLLSSQCLICATPFEPFMSLGRQPIANAFLTPDEFDAEFFYELRVGLCPDCHMVQLVEPIEPTKLFHENYAFFSGTSTRMARHFKQLADELRSEHLSHADSFAVELGSNDGIMLQHLAHQGIRHLGIEPSRNVAEAARAKGVRTLTRFFDERLALEIVRTEGQADVVAAANVMCHIADLTSVIRGIKLLLKPSGVLVFEDPYLGDIVEKTSYDQIYDEHAFYFSVKSLSRLFEMHDLQIADVQSQPVHGGSMRYSVMHRGAARPSMQVTEQLKRERDMGLDRVQTFIELSHRIERSRADLLYLLRSFRADGKRIVGYGATSKSTTVTNYCGITSELIEFISDTTPIKQGKYSPGLHIPVRPHADFEEHPPDYALLFAWNHAEEILEKERRFIANGGRFIVYVPRVALLS